MDYDQILFKAIKRSVIICFPKQTSLGPFLIVIRVERDDYRLPKTYAVRQSFLFKNIFCIEREK